MSMPNIPDINPDVNVDIKDTISMLFSSIALEEMGLSHIINAEAEKIQYVLGTLDTKHTGCRENYELDEILKLNKYVDRTLRGVLQNQLLLQIKLQDTIDLYERYVSEKGEEECVAKRIE